MKKSRDDRRGLLAFTLFLLLLCCFYLFDAARHSTDIENLVVILPGTIIAVLLGLVITIKSLRSPQISANEEKPQGSVAGNKWRPYILMSLVLGYVMLISVAGFIIPSILFLASSLFVMGERRVTVLLGFSLSLTAVLILAVRLLVPLPEPILGI